MEDESKETPVTISQENSGAPEFSPSSNGDAVPAVLPQARRDEWSTVRRLALKQLNRFMTLEPNVLRGDDPDAIHDMRVASRRLQQILDLMYPKPRAREIRGLRRKIRRSRRCLSEVRNCDVMIERVDKQLAVKRVSRREIRMALRSYLRDRRAQSFEKALRKLGKTNLATFYLELRGFIRPGASAPHAQHHAAASELTSEVFFQRVGASLGRVWKGFESQLELSHADPQPSVLHGARIATKRLRYLIEVIAAFEVGGAEENLRWLRLLQRRLGEWHDLEVLEQMMIEMVARPEFLRERLETAMGVEKLMARNRAVKKKMQDAYFRLTLDSAEFQRLKDWVGHLLSSPSAAFAAA
jgi:CHAD domain-containing protein